MEMASKLVLKAQIKLNYGEIGLVEKFFTGWDQLFFEGCRRFNLKISSA